jgi:hypothetical protein
MAMQCCVCLKRAARMARAIHSSSGVQQQPATDALRQLLRSKSVVLASGLQRRRSSLEGRLANLSQEMSRISGYQSIEGLKQQVEEHGPSAATFRNASSGSSDRREDAGGCPEIFCRRQAGVYPGSPSPSGISGQCRSLLDRVAQVLPAREQQSAVEKGLVDDCGCIALHRTRPARSSQRTTGARSQDALSYRRRSRRQDLRELVSLPSGYVCISSPCKNPRHPGEVPRRADLV